MKVFIDADSILFKAACTQRNSFDCRKVIKAVIKRTINDCWGDESYLAIKGKNNFRYEIYGDYKIGRTKGPPMDQGLKDRLNYSYGYIQDNFDAVASHGWEADDQVAMWAYEARAAGEDFVVARIDKDLAQIPGKHYNYNKPQEGVISINDDEADMFLCKQLLTGDSGDSIPGLKGIGAKTADKILNGVPYHRRLKTVRETWKTHRGKGWEGNLQLSANLLYMWTKPDDFFDVFADREPLNESKNKDRR